MGPLSILAKEETAWGGSLARYTEWVAEEIWLNGPESIHIARGGVAERIELRLTESALRDLVERMLQSTGRRVDISQPFVDASLPDVIYINL